MDESKKGPIKECRNQRNESMNNKKSYQLGVGVFEINSTDRQR